MSLAVRMAVPRSHGDMPEALTQKSGSDSSISRPAEPCLVRFQWASINFSMSIKPPFHGQGGVCSRAHFRTSKCPSSDAEAHVASLHGQGGVCSRAHRSTSSCPPSAAAAHVFQSQKQGGSCSRAHFSISRCPPLAAAAHVDSSQGQPFSLAQRNRVRELKKSLRRGGSVKSTSPRVRRSTRLRTALSEGPSFWMT